MYVDFKITTWERVYVNAKKAVLNKILKDLKNGTVVTANDLFSLYDSDNLTLSPLNDVEETLTPKENGGCATIELYNSKGELLFCNSLKNE